MVISYAWMGISMLLTSVHNTTHVGHFTIGCCTPGTFPACFVHSVCVHAVNSLDSYSLDHTSAWLPSAQHILAGRPPPGGLLHVHRGHGRLLLPGARPLGLGTAVSLHASSMHVHIQTTVTAMSQGNPSAAQGAPGP